MKGAVTILICAITLVLGEANISYRPDRIINDNPRLAPIICAAAGSDGVLVAHEDCSKFYICSHGRRVAMPCPENLLYNPNKEQCDWAENVSCFVGFPEVELDFEHSEETNNNGNDDPSQAREICAAEGSDGIMVAHEHCNKFYKCSSRIRMTLSCPPSLLFNPRTEQCDWPKNVNCGTRIIPEADAAMDVRGVEGGVVNDDYNLAPAICAAEGSDGVLVAHKHCNEFYKCDFGTPVALRCPLNLLYNPSKEQCDWPDNVDCGTRIIPDPEDVKDDESAEEDIVNDDYQLAPEICAAEGSDGVLVTHRNCNQFYQCAYGLPVAMSCPPNLYYNPSKEQCDWPDNVKCGSRLIPDDDSGKEDDIADDKIVNDDYNLAPQICAADGSNGVLVANKYCNQFYKCAYGLPVAMECPPNLYYNPRNEQCDWPENVKCGSRLIPGDDTAKGDDNAEGNAPNDDYTLAPEICAAEGSDGVLVAHQYCNQFYKCAHGLPVALSCQLNLLYNPKKEQCDWPQNVDCKGRII